jgi:hypothetical protein
MFFFRRFRAESEPPNLPCSACASASSGVKNGKAVVTATDLCLDCQKKTPPISTDPAAACCAICEQDDGPFPEAFPWEDSVAPPAICIACIEQSLSTMHVGEHHVDNSSVGNSPAGHRGNTLRYLPCVACHRSRPTSAFPDGHVAESCQHQPEVCLDCIEKAIVEDLDDSLPNCISCPQCGDAMSAVDVWRLSSTGTFTR